jgi:hypothetical protein
VVGSAVTTVVEAVTVGATAVVVARCVVGDAIVVVVVDAVAVTGGRVVAVGDTTIGVVICAAAQPVTISAPITANASVERRTTGRIASVFPVTATDCRILPATPNTGRTPAETIDAIDASF